MKRRMGRDWTESEHGHKWSSSGVLTSFRDLTSIGSDGSFVKHIA